MSEAPAIVDSKVCPECAESVKAAANVCRYCGHRFDGQGRLEAEPPAATKSLIGARLLSFLIAGLGHFYVGESGRGGVFLASTLAAVVSFLAGAENPLAITLVVTVIAIVDSGRGAESTNAGKPPRPVTGGLWAMLALSYTAAAAAATFAPAATNETDSLSEQCITTTLGATLCGESARGWCSTITAPDLGTARACRSVGWTAPEEPETNEFGDEVAAPKPKAPAVPKGGGTVDQCADQGYDRLSCIARGWK